MDNSKNITIVEWCAGYGGIHLGLKRAIPNLRVIAYGEIEAFACANLVAKMEAGLLDSAPIWTDIKTFPCEEFRDRVDILVAGYPCQPFSAAGKRLGTEDPRHLWPHIARSIGIIRPRLCFFENVEGHISLGLREVVGELESIGYTTAWGIFSASEVGAPHQRKRVFILAYLVGAGLQGFRADSCEDKEGREEPDGYAWSGCLRNREQWPSRPGEPQHGWEPPRVIVADSKRTTSTKKASEWKESIVQDGADLRDEHSTSRADVANSKRSRGEEPEHLDADIPPEPSGRDTEVVGNADHGRLTSGLDAGSGTEADRGGQSDIEQADGSTMGNASRQRCEQDAALRGEQQPSGTSEERGTRDAEEPDGQTQPPLGGDIDGNTDRLDYAELFTTCDNRTDELRLLGNGVVPATAERAFRVLIQQLDTPPQTH